MRGTTTPVRGGVLPADRRTPVARAATALLLLVAVGAAAGTGATLLAPGGDPEDPVPDRRVVRGTSADDELVLDDLGVTAAATEVFGAAGDDFVTAFPASYDGVAPTPVALLSGGRGNDSVTGYALTLDGGRGDDLIRTHEFRRPVVSSVRCGPGVDTLAMDRQVDGPLDEFGPDCEEVRVWIWSTVPRDQVVTGTKYADQIRTVSNSRGGGNDIIRSRGGDDRVQGDWGSDTAYLGRGDDTYSDVATHAGDDLDRIRCGPGRDVVEAYRVDRVADDCEDVRYWD